MRGKWYTGLAFILPAIVFSFAFMLYPLGYAIYLSFHRYAPLQSAEIINVGLKNYLWLINSDIVRHSLWVSVKFTLGSVFIEVIAGLALAVILAHHLRMRITIFENILNRVSRSLFLLPFAIPATTAATAWKMLLHPQFGPVNELLGTNVAWLSEYPLLGVILADSWKMFPFLLFPLFAAAMSVPNSLYEAAKTDGASKWQEFRYITLPLILPVLLVVAAFRSVDAFTKVFDMVYIMTGGGPGVQTQVLPLRIWKEAFSYLHYGRSATLAVLAICVSTLFGSVILIRRKR